MPTNRPRQTSRPPSSPTAHSLGLRIMLPAARVPSEPAPRMYVSSPRSSDSTAKTVRPAARRPRGCK
jgi:hypothetical protein